MYTDSQIQDIVTQTGLYNAITSRAYMSTAAGGFFNQLQTQLVGVNKFNTDTVTMNIEHTGLTFITRPKLNLRSSNLRCDPVLGNLDSHDIRSIPYMIRCLLDRQFTYDFSEEARLCPLFDIRNPFITPLAPNSLVGISGFPDFVLETETTEGSFFGDNYSMGIGSDFMRKSVDLTLNFKDMPYGIIMSILMFWVRYIALQHRGIVQPYNKDIEENRLNYTCSIYRFTFDSTLTRISSYAKATGCFPSAVPFGMKLNMSDNEIFNQSAMKFSVPFKANVVEYNNPIILREFNMLMHQLNGRRPFGTGLTGESTYGIAPHTSDYNFVGIPYILTPSDRTSLPRMVFYYDYDEITPHTFDAKMEEASDEMNRMLDRLSSSSEMFGDPGVTF